MPRSTDLDYGSFEALTFDCYGTLIDWETGLANAFRPVLDAHGIMADPEDVLARYATHEEAAERGPYLRYREVLGTGLRRVLTDFGAEGSDVEAAVFGASVVDWPAFPDSADALARLKGRFRLGVLTNCDDDLFAASSRRLGVQFDWVVTAQQVGSYKPNERGFHVLFERLGIPRERILHVAQSLFHDHVPARRLGLTSVWINRRAGRDGTGATPAVEGAAPAATFPTMAAFADAATA